MSLECQTVKIKKVPYTETDPVFTAWAKSYSADFYSTYTTVSSYSAIWDGGTDSNLSSLTGNWQNTYNYFSVQSANNIDVYNTVNSYSSLWIIDSNADNQVRELTSNWQNTYSIVSSSSSNWNSVYSQFNNQSANNIDVYNTVNSYSANWNYQGNEIKVLTANWENTYTTVQTNSADWLQTLSFDYNSGNLSISDGNTVSISAFNRLSATDLLAQTIDFEPLAAAPSHADGRLYYDSVEQTLVFWDGDPTLKYPINKMLWLTGVNKTGSTIPKGTVVYLSGAQGNRGKMWPALATTDLRSADTIGVTMQATNINQEGYIMAIGELEGIDTRNFAEGTTLYLSPTAAGGITSVKPQAPNHIVKVGFALNSTVNGKIYVEIDNGYELDELHNIRINGVTDGQGLVYNSVSALWINSDLYNGSDLKALSSNWQNTYTQFSTQSANNASVYSTVQANSATNWNYQGTDVKSLTTNWQNTFTNFSVQSANNISSFNTVNSNSANWGIKGTGLTLFTEISSVTGINNTIPVYALSATASAVNIDVAILPKGTGSFSLQIPDGTTIGGNKRGQYAIDFQRTRNTSSKIASNTYSTIINGQNNTSSGGYSTVINGASNTSSGGYSTVINGASNTSSNGYSTVINGASNTISGSYSTVINGVANSISGNYATVINGQSNTNNGQYSTILNGENNNISSDYSTILDSYYANADRFGQISKSNARFYSTGDAQRTEFLLYGVSANEVDVELTLDNSSAKLTLTSDSFQLCTIQILGVDEDGNFSQFLRKMTIKNISGSYTLSHIESIGTDVTNAGNCVISVDDIKGIVLTCGSLSDNNTVWLASINAVELYVPQPYTSVSVMSLNHGINNTETNINSLFS